LYSGSFLSVQATEAELPASAELDPAPNVATGVDDVVDEFCEPAHGVPGADTVQV
jgi:hypothetical protein